MLLLLNPDSPTPLFDQIYGFFKQAIIDGTLKFNTQLPSIRQLAKSLEVSNNTVIAAYQQLTDEGYLMNVPRKGLFVANLDTQEVNPQKKGQEPPQFTPQKTEKPRADYAFNLNQAGIDEHHFPIKAWRKCINWALDKPFLQYGVYFGEPVLKKALASYLFKSRGVKTQPEQIVIGAGTIQLMSLLATLFKNKMPEKSSKQVAFEEPGYQASRQVWLDYGYQVQPVAVDPLEGIRLDALEPLHPDLVYLTPSHHFPLGGIMPVAHRLQILQWAKERNCYLIEDDYDSEFRFRGKPIPALQALDTHERVIYAGTFSKAFLPSLRLAYLVLPPHLLPHLEALQHLGQSTSVNMQRAMAIFMEEGYWDKHLRKMRKVYKHKFEQALTSIQQIMGDKVTVTTQASGLSLLIKVHTDLSEETLVQKAREADIWMKGKSDAWLVPDNLPQYPHIAFGFGATPIDQIATVVEKLYQVWFEDHSA
ncbi:MAG TPA: hypothetical protein DCS93_20350 [Microscillaceae bacterium]|nr:hypothetical protein [Microscillaceae bacterium]